MLVTAVAAFAALSAAVIVAAVSGDNSSDTTTGTVPETGSQQSSTSAAVSPTVPLSAPSTAAQTTTTVVSTTSPVGGELVRLTSAAAATGVTVTPTDPNATATFNGPLPVFNVAIDCIESGCSFSLRAFAPGTVTEDGSTTIPATAGRFLATSTQADTCTGDQGTQFSRPLTGTIDLAVTGAQLVRGVSVPQRIGGTFTRVIPDAGYVPKVGDVVDEGTEVGCPGQTLIFTVDAPLEPSS